MIHRDGRRLVALRKERFAPRLVAPAVYHAVTPHCRARLGANQEGVEARIAALYRIEAAIRASSAAAMALLMLA